MEKNGKGKWALCSITVMLTEGGRTEERPPTSVSSSSCAAHKCMADAPPTSVSQLFMLVSFSVLLFSFSLFSYFPLILFVFSFFFRNSAVSKNLCRMFKNQKTILKESKRICEIAPWVTASTPRFSHGHKNGSENGDSATQMTRRPSSSFE